MILGIHGSIRAGYLNAVDEATRLSCDALQIFSYRRHHDPTLPEIDAFKRAIKASRISRLLVHVRYLPSLASSDPLRRERSVRWLTREMRLAAALGADGLVLHAGAYSPGDDVGKGLSIFVEGASTARQTSGADVPVLIENVPGGGRRMGGTLEELADLGARLMDAGFSVGYCLDTAHAWAQGYDIASSVGMGRFLDLAQRLLGADRINAFHLNDTLSGLGSHREHHWHWGKGRLGLEGLEHLVRAEKFRQAVAILETPKGEMDAMNLELVRKLMALTN